MKVLIEYLDNGIKKETDINPEDLYHWGSITVSEKRKLKNMKHGCSMDVSTDRGDAKIIKLKEESCYLV